MDKKNATALRSLPKLTLNRGEGHKICQTSQGDCPIGCNHITINIEVVESCQG